jgi:hypothetical protein
MQQWIERCGTQPTSRASLRDLAEASGISHMTVKRIVERDAS